MNKWDKRFLNVAREVSTWSKDPSTQVGAVAVRDKRILSTGYNGFPTSVEDDYAIYNNRKEKYKRIVHAEMNVIYNAGLHGISLKDSTLYIWGLPVCSQCALGIIQSGIIRIVAVNVKPERHDWCASSELSNEMFGEKVENIIVNTGDFHA